MGHNPSVRFLIFVKKYFKISKRKMEELILAHFEQKEDFRNFPTNKVQVHFFFTLQKELKFFDETVFLSEYCEEEGILLNRKKEGLWTDWWDNGNKWSEGEFRNGKKEGHWKSWWDNGNKDYEGSYRNGKAEGR